ncbi:MAG: TolC family protein, partial [Gammaproteobacteria bacterium]|nr:TolC family protein [Gammaproteobacteria bacterium]
MLRKKHLISFFLLTVISQTAIALDFAEALQRAKTNDPEIQAAEYSYQAVLQSRGLSEAALLPNISLAVYTTQNQQDISNSTIASIPNGSSDSDTQGYTLSLTQSIYNHSNYKLLQQTDINIATAKAEIEAARQALILRVANVYYNVLAAADNVKFAVAEKQAIARQLEQTRKRFEVGLIAITDVKESQAQYDIAVAQQISADNKLDISKEALRSLIGPLDQNVSPLSDNVPLVIPQPNDIRQWTDTAIANNLTLQAAQLAFEAAQKQVDIEQSGHYPSLDLSVQHSDDQLDNDAGDRDS